MAPIGSHRTNKTVKNYKHETIQRHLQHPNITNRKICFTLYSETQTLATKTWSTFEFMSKWRFYLLKST